MSVQSNTYRVFQETVDGFNELLGRLASWLTLSMVLMQVFIIGMRYLFEANQMFGLPYIWWQEVLNMYMQGGLILLGVSYTLLHNAHVRVDIFYSAMNRFGKNRVDFIGSLLLLVPVALFITWSAWPDMISASWKHGEGTQNPGGPKMVQWLRLGIVVMAGLLVLQGVANAIKCGLRLLGYEVPNDPYETDESKDEIQKLETELALDKPETAQ